MEKTPFLPSERQKTDESLIAERENTNNSGSSSRSNTEKKIDLAVVDERQEADRKTDATRALADAKRDADRASTHYKAKDEVQDSDSRLSEERHRADVAINLERKRVDAAIDNERELKEALASRLLERERKITDSNLKDERFQTDVHIHQASGSLADEVQGHSQTKSALTSREEVLAIVSHDLRNPIGAAASCANMLLDETDFKDLDPEVKYWVSFIKRNVDTSLRLISDLLDVERISQGKILVQPVRANLDTVIRETLEAFHHSAEEQQVEIKVLPHDLQAELMFDPDRIRQVISNLVGNAIKFTPAGGSITVRLEPDLKEVRISVTDTGPGIAPEQLSNIFGRFTQLGSQSRSGLGLGLYIAKMLVEAHAGRLTAESTVGTGSTFTFSIPRS